MIDIIPVRMINEYAYCPRLFHLMHVDGRWDDNLYTDQGRSVHTRIDDADDPLPAPEETGDEAPHIVRSVSLGSERLGITAKLDLVELGERLAVPVDTKRGKPPDTPERCWEPERVQLMCQGMLLREHGHACSCGILYFAAARQRVRVDFTPELEERTLHLIREARAAAERTLPPPPLDDSPKCFGCSLSGICLPDEVTGLRQAEPDHKGWKPLPDVRRLFPARDDALPLYVQEQGARVGKSGESLTVSKGSARLGEFLLKDVSQVILCGNVAITAQACNLLCERGIPIVHLSTGHWFYGITQGIGLRNAYTRAAQFSVAADDSRAIGFAREFVRAKIINQRTLLRRNGPDSIKPTLREIKKIADSIDRCNSSEQLLGVEGTAAALYFQSWPELINAGSIRDEFRAAGRNRRPPRDPLNAMLSFGYALLTKELTIALIAEGLDPYWGLYHRARHGKPALALDLMEEFRPLIVDSAVISAVNNGMLGEGDFIRGAGSCAMKDKARKALIKAFELRLDQMITHPVFDYRCSWRSVIRVQARLLAKVLRGEIPRYFGMTTR